MDSNPPPHLSNTTSVVRALLITDLVGSTRLIERLGDRRAARLLAQEEEQARHLARHYNGQEIDRSDGFLFLFDHAWQAVGFALDYHRVLKDLSSDLPLQLQGRVGIHVGETYLTPNAPEHVARGAKQVEVSGLAKPIAARLMTAANPGQTLLSGTAFDLAARPCIEHLPKDSTLHWHAHGAWLLKGVEQPVQVHAVAHDLRTAAREPLENDKVRSLRRRQRRRLLLTGIGTAAAVALPLGYWKWHDNALRDWESKWLVVADWQLEQGNADLAAVLATAFRIALQQSRFAYVMDPGAVLLALQRMRGEPPVGREEAIEIARRESAAAAIIPSFTKFGGGLLLSAELVEAVTERTIAAAQEQIADLGGLTVALDRLSAQIRRNVGEPGTSVQRDALPLAKVTTANLDALRLYSQVDDLMQQRKGEEAIAALERAIVLDPQFASAHAKLGTVHAIRRSELSVSEKHWRIAASLQERLTPRERMYVDGCISWTEDPVVMRARWGGMVSKFPDDAAAVNNAALVEWTHFGNLVAAERGFRLGIPIPHRWNYVIWHHLGYVEMGQGRVAEGLSSFKESLKRAEHPAHFGIVRAQLLAGETDQAMELLARFRDNGSVSWRADQCDAEVLAHVFVGKPEAALAVAERQREMAITEKFRTAERMGLRNKALLLAEQGDKQAAHATARVLHELLRADLGALQGGGLLLPPFDAMMLTAFAARMGWQAGEFEMPEALQGRWIRFPSVLAAERLTRAWRALNAGKAPEALRLAREGRDYMSLYAFFELEVAAYTALGETVSRNDRLRQARKLLHQGFGENFSYLSTHLENLQAWQRMGKLEASAQPSTGDAKPKGE
ncbi:MAG: putative peptide modification system cyclase [Gammaproteobacteria bacterium]|nr:MAG: putative peptide modification system cyclase [Gammaproteobacteria bacterium]